RDAAGLKRLVPAYGPGGCVAAWSATTWTARTRRQARGFRSRSRSKPCVTALPRLSCARHFSTRRERPRRRRPEAAGSGLWAGRLCCRVERHDLDRPHTTAGTRLQIEVTVEAVRHRVAATVVRTPFFNPPRKTATPPA